jgi:hypothetical protein
MSEANVTGNVEPLAGAEERAARVAQIIGMCDYTRHVSGLSDALTQKLTQGCMVVTGMQAGERDSGSASRFEGTVVSSGRTWCSCVTRMGSL